MKNLTTPGPWFVEETEDSYFILAGEDSDQIALINKAFEPGNAQLIAAAPEMLKALYTAHEVLWNGYKPDSVAAEIARKNILAAIAKAEEK